MATAALLVEDVLEEVGHAQWVFVMPKMLRPERRCSPLHSRYYGAYSNASRGKRRRQDEETGLGFDDAEGPVGSGDANAPGQPADLRGAGPTVCGGQELVFKLTEGAERAFQRAADQ